MEVPPQRREEDVSDKHEEDRATGLPSHPGTDDSTHYQKAATTGNRATLIGLIVAFVLVALIVILHLTGVVGPGAH